MFDFEGSRSEFLRILAEMGEEPAFINRSKAPETALKALLKSSEVDYDELLKWPRRHFASFVARVAGDWARVQRWLAGPEEIQHFVTLESLLSPKEQQKLPLFATDRGLLKQFLDSAIRFNESWLSFANGPGLEHVNQLRDNYNRFYPMEKACAFGNDRVVEGFEELPLLDSRFLLERFPLLTLPEFA